MTLVAAHTPTVVGTRYPTTKTPYYQHAAKLPKIVGIDNECALAFLQVKLFTSDQKLDLGWFWNWNLNRKIDSTFQELNYPT